MTRRCRWGVIGALVVVCAVLAASGCGTIRAGFLLRDAVSPSPDMADQVVETEFDVNGGGAAVRCLLVRPVDSQCPLPTFVVVHGAVDVGPDDRRMIALTRALARRGATVVSPDLESLRRFELDPDAPRVLARVARAVVDRADLSSDGRVAFLGISVGGAYSILAAARPELEGRVSAVLAFGAYADLGDLLRPWMLEPPDAHGVLDAVTDGRRRLLLGNLDQLVDERDREEVERTLRALLAGRDPAVASASLGVRARLVRQAAQSEEPLDSAQADSLLDAIASTTAALSPARIEHAPDVPVYLLHATSDPVVPVAMGKRLRDRLLEIDCDVTFFETDLFDHVTATQSPSLLEGWPLLWFFADYLDAAGL